jgi:hypothetical protein
MPAVDCPLAAFEARGIPVVLAADIALEDHWPKRPVAFLLCDIAFDFER